MDKQRDFVLRTIEERGVKFIRLWFTDVLGRLSAKSPIPHPRQQLEHEPFEEGGRGRTNPFEEIFP